MAEPVENNPWKPRQLAQALRDCKKNSPLENQTQEQATQACIVKTMDEFVRAMPSDLRVAVKKRLVPAPLDINRMASAESLETFVVENPFRTRAPEDKVLPTFAAVKEKLPDVTWEGHDDAVRCYWKAWEIAFGNLHKPDHEQNGFVSDFIDPAFNGDIFMWDTAFMVMFGMYGRDAFDFLGSNDNFYAHQQSDGFISRQIRQRDGSEVFAMHDPSSTGPNILPWTEWRSYETTGDKERLQDVFPGLLAYWLWLDKNRTWPDGTYFTSGWGCGMDNQPRMPDEPIPELNHGHMAWIDASLQAIFAGKLLVKMARELGRDADVKIVEEKVSALTDHINKEMWNDEDDFYFDRYRDGSLSELKTVGAYWALLAQTVPEDRSAAFIEHLRNPNEFNRANGVPALPADEAAFDPNGNYWNGGVWSPTTYMVLQGLTTQGEDDLAYEIGREHLDNVVTVFNQTGTLWENYAPDSANPGKMKVGEDEAGNPQYSEVGKDFVGWTGLSPINVLLEYVFGLRPDVPNNTLVWDVRELDTFGVEKYPFGKEGLLNLKCEKRSVATEEPQIHIESNVPLTVILKWQGGEKKIQINS